MSIEFVNPTRNGLASRGSRWLMNEESLSAALAFRPPPPCTACSTGWFAGLLITAGSRSADWNSGVGAIARNAAAILSGRPLKSTDRKIAVPSVPPICRKNVADEVATPMSCGGTAFWIARMSVCMFMPSPSPNRNA